MMAIVSNCAVLAHETGRVSTCLSSFLLSSLAAVELSSMVDIDVGPESQSMDVLLSELRTKKVAIGIKTANFLSLSLGSEAWGGLEFTTAEECVGRGVARLFVGC